jgi:hypothetical protein
LVAITPLPQWVRVIGGYSELQFAAKRLPTIRASAVELRRIQWHAEGDGAIRPAMTSLSYTAASRKDLKRRT